MVFNLPARTGPTILPASGNVGAQYTPAAGWAQAIHYRTSVLGEADWDGASPSHAGGEGSTAANGFWAALNIAATLKLPMIFFIENNCYGISVPADLQTPGGNIAANLACYGNLKILDGDGTDRSNAGMSIRRRSSHVRSGRGPCLLHLYVVRLTGHTFIDDQSYKPGREAQPGSTASDPLMQLKSSAPVRRSGRDAGKRSNGSRRRAGSRAHAEAEAQPEPIPADVLPPSVLRRDCPISRAGCAPKAPARIGSSVRPRPRSADQPTRRRPAHAGSRDGAQSHACWSLGRTSA